MPTFLIMAWGVSKVSAFQGPKMCAGTFGMRTSREETMLPNCVPDPLIVQARRKNLFSIQRECILILYQWSATFFLRMLLLQNV